MGNITGILSNNFAHAQAVSSRPNCLGLVKEARPDTCNVECLNLIYSINDSLPALIIIHIVHN